MQFKRILNLSLIIMLVPFLLNGQEELGKSFTEKAQSLVLLSNQKKLIPVKRLESIQIASLTFGMNAENVFQETLDKYTLIKRININTEDMSSLQGISNYDLVLVGLVLTPDDENYGQVMGIANQLAMAPNVVLTIFDHKNRAARVPLLLQRATHVIYAPGADKAYQSLAAQLIFGGVGAEGKLQNELLRFKKGHGLTTKGGIRLRYSPPAVVGMNKKKLQQGIRKIVNEGINKEAFPGAQVLVIKDGHVVFHQAYGHHMYDKNRAVELTDIYDFASVTKITSGLPALMKLHGEGQFDLDAPLQKYFPKFKDSNKADLQFRPMLAHYAQLKPWIPYWKSTIKKSGKFKWRTFKKKPSKKYPIKVTDELYLHKTYKERAIYKAIKESPLNEEKVYKYSGLLFYLLPEIITDLTKTDFETYLKTNFYHRLGAYTITYNPYLHFPLDRIVPTENDTFFRKTQLHGRVHDEGAAMMDGVSCNAGLFGSANDLGKLMQMYLNKGQFGGEYYISEKSVDEFTKCQYCDEGNHRGLGFDKPLIEYDPKKSSTPKSASLKTFGHSGYTGTLTWVDPEQDLIYIFFSNRVFPTRDNRKIYQLDIRPRIHQVIYDSIVSE